MKDVKKYNDKGIQHYNLGRYNEAIECYDTALLLDPKNAIAHINKGAALYNLGRYNEAIECYNTAIQLDPKDAAAHINKGFLLDNLGQYNEAIECYDTAIQLDPKYAAAHNNKGFALKNLGRYNEAIECYDAALQIDPRDATAHFNKGFALNNLGRYNEAIQSLNQAILLDPNSPNSYNHKGFSLYKLGNNFEAIEFYNKAIQLNPTYAEAFFNKGLVLQTLRQIQEALECFAQAQQIKPELEIPQVSVINEFTQIKNKFILEDIWQLLQQNGAGQDDRSQIKIWNYKEIIPNKQFLKNLQVLGEGGYGTVYLLNIKGSDYALKIMNQKRDQQKLIDAFYLECQSLLYINNLRVLRLVGVSIDTSDKENICFCLLTDYMPKGSLYQVINSGTLFSEFKKVSPIRFYKKLNLLSQIAEGLQAIHFRNLIHRDMKSLNILLDDSDSPKIADLGLLHESSIKTTKEQKGSPQ